MTVNNSNIENTDGVVNLFIKDTNKKHVVVRLIWDSQKITWMDTVFEQDEDYYNKKNRGEYSKFNAIPTHSLHFSCLVVGALLFLG